MAARKIATGMAIKIISFLLLLGLTDDKFLFVLFGGA
jgi:hypothetical protein